MCILGFFARWAAVSTALVVILFSIPAVSIAESEDLSFSAFAKPDAGTAGFSGMTKLETWYEPLINGFPEVGEPWDSATRPRINLAPTLQADWAASGIVRNESSYAFITLKAPDTQVASSIMPIWLDDGGVPIPQTQVPVAPSGTTRDPIRYSGALAHPALDLGLYADENSPWIDEVDLDAAITTTLPVTARFDFSPEFGSGGFADATAVDASGGFGYFAAKEIGGIAVMEFTATGSQRRGAVYLANSAGDIRGMAVNEADGRLYVVTRNPVGLQVFQRPGTSGIPNFLYTADLPGDFNLIPSSVAVDAERGLLYVASLPTGGPNGVSDTSFQIAKFRIEGDSLVAIPGAGNLLPGGEAFIFAPSMISSTRRAGSPPTITFTAFAPVAATALLFTQPPKMPPPMRFQRTILPAPPCRSAF